MTSTRHAPAAAVLAAMTGIAAPGAHADTGEPPRAPRVLHVPTATVQQNGVVFGTIGADPALGTPYVSVSAGLGGVAEVDVTLHDQFRLCLRCDGDDREIDRATIASALFKVGLDAGTLGRFQPAIALGYRRSLASQSQSDGGVAVDPELARLYLAVGWSLGSLDVTIGGDLWDARSNPDTPTLSDGDVSAKIRPFAGLAWRPSNVPRTSILLDWGWQPEFRSDGPELVGTGGFGVRYQALSWGSAELAVRVGTGEAVDLGAIVRLNGVFDLRRLVR
jgi:hypothetical protein